MSETTKRTGAAMKADHAKWGARGAKWVKDGQTFGLEVLEHVDAHGDVTVADSLVNAMPKGTKRNAMIEWLISFGKLALLDTPNKDTGALFKFDKARITNLAGAKEKPWQEFQPEPDPLLVFDAQAVTIKALEKLIATSKKAKTVEHGEVLSKVSALLAELSPSKEDPAGNPDPVDGAPLPTGEALF